MARLRVCCYAVAERLDGVLIARLLFNEIAFEKLARRGIRSSEVEHFRATARLGSPILVLAYRAVGC